MAEVGTDVAVLVELVQRRRDGRAGQRQVAGLAVLGLVALGLGGAFYYMKYYLEP